MSDRGVIALDTNVLARFILEDSAHEWRVAVELIESNSCSVSWSVLMELCWVLERSVRLPRDQVANGLAMIGEIEGIMVPDEQAFAWAIDRYAKGADFADMIHLVSAIAGSSAFACFDRKLSRQAGAEAPLEIRTLRA
jgi:predicted nucleic-acid-binding protein